MLAVPSLVSKSSRGSPTVFATDWVGWSAAPPWGMGELSDQQNVLLKREQPTFPSQGSEGQEAHSLSSMGMAVAFLLWPMEGHGGNSQCWLFPRSCMGRTAIPGGINGNSQCWLFPFWSPKKLLVVSNPVCHRQGQMTSNPSLEEGVSWWTRGTTLEREHPVLAVP